MHTSVTAAKGPGSADGMPGISNRTVLLISEAPAMVEGHERTFARLGYRQVVSAPLAFGDRVAASMQPDAVILFNTYTRAHATNIVPAIRDLRGVCDSILMVVNPGDSLALTLQCFEAGADDVITSRVPGLEMDMRLRAYFRRMDTATSPSLLEERFIVGDIEISTASRSVAKAGVPIELSPTEYRLLTTLAEHMGRIVPARTLTAAVWGPECREETHYLRLYIRYLRQKLEDDPASPRYIVNRRGTGYALTAPGEDAVDIPVMRSA
jgi:two-component system KDP operon response regulator KdpE